MLAHKYEIHQTNTNTHIHTNTQWKQWYQSVIYQIKLALYYIYNLVLKHEFYIILSSLPGRLNPWIDLIISLADDKILKTILKSSV